MEFFADIAPRSAVVQVSLSRFEVRWMNALFAPSTSTQTPKSRSFRCTSTGPARGAMMPSSLKISRPNCSESEVGSCTELFK